MMTYLKGSAHLSQKAQRPLLSKALAVPTPCCVSLDSASSRFTLIPPLRAPEGTGNKPFDTSEAAHDNNPAHNQTNITWSPTEISPQLAAAPSGSNARTYTHEKLMSVPHSIPVARAILTE